MWSKIKTLFAKIRHIVDELHRKAAKWLCSKFRVVLIPVFDTQQMITSPITDSGCTCTTKHVSFHGAK
jgi:hypothetical protein